MTTAIETYIPKNMKKWTLPDSYMGEHYDEYYIFLTLKADSRVIEVANWRAGLEKLSFVEGISEPMLITPSFGHYVVGWVSFIGIHESNIESLKIADQIKEDMKEYCIIDDEILCKVEEETALKYWKDFTIKGRKEFIRENRSSFEFQNYSQVKDSLRGNSCYGIETTLIDYME